LARRKALWQGRAAPKCTLLPARFCEEPFVSNYKQKMTLQICNNCSSRACCGIEYAVKQCHFRRLM
jgi:hypothetical protein